MCPLLGGGVGDCDMDGDGDLCVVFLSILHQLLLLPLLQPASLLLDEEGALSVAKLLEERLGCCYTSWCRLSIIWLTTSLNSSGAVVLQQSRALSALVSTLRISLIEALSWLWLNLYLALMVR